MCPTPMTKKDCHALLTSSDYVKQIARALTSAPQDTEFVDRIEWCLQHNCAPMVGCSIHYLPPAGTISSKFDTNSTSVISVYWGAASENTQNSQLSALASRWCKSFNPFEANSPAQVWGSPAPLERCLSSSGKTEGGPRHLPVFEAPCAAPQLGTWHLVVMVVA